MIRSLLLFTLLFSASGFASDQASVVFTGQSADTVDLSSVLYRDEVREREVVTTCYRVEIRYRQVCPGPRPRPYPGRSCRMVPVRVRIPYPCTIVERDVTRVFDANVVARVNLSYGEVPAGVTARENVKMKLQGQNLSIDVDGSGALLVTSTSQISSARSGNTVNVNANYSLKFRDANELKSAFGDGVTGLSMKKGSLSFKMTEASQNLPVNLRLKIVRKRSLADDVVLFDREIPRDAFASTSGDGKITFTNTLSSLGVPSMGKGKYRVSLTASVAFPGEEILNDEVAGGLKDSSALELKVK